MDFLSFEYILTYFGIFGITFFLINFIGNSLSK